MDGQTTACCYAIQLEVMRNTESASSTSKKPSDDTENNHQNSRSSEKLNENTNRSNKKETQGEPKLRKTSTLTSSLAIVLHINQEVVILWVIQSHKVTKINQFGDFFIGYNQGDWVILGLFADGNIGSISPKPLLVKVHPTRISNGHVLLYSTITEYGFMRCKSMEFGKLGVNDSLTHLFTKRGKETLGVWIKWLSEEEVRLSTHKCEWEVVDIDNDLHVGKEEFGDHEYRECIEYLRVKEHPRLLEDKATKYLENEIVRHWGFIVEVNDKRQICVWSPGMTSDTDHLSTFPDEHLVNQKIDLTPFIGQWIKFDTTVKIMEKVTNPRGGSRLFIGEFMPVSSPRGMAVCQIGRCLKVVLTCTLVKGTEHPLVYEIADFGFVLNRNAILRSGAQMQIVLERTPYKIRRAYGIGWKVVEAQLVNISEATTYDMTEPLITQIVPKREAYTLCMPFMTDRQRYFTSTRFNSDGNRKDNYVIFTPYEVGSTTSNNTNRKRPVYQAGMTAEYNALVEKLDSNKRGGILWVFETGANVHFVYADELKAKVGETVIAQLILKPDSSTKTGFRWHLINYKVEPAKYTFHITNGRLSINEEAIYSGQQDRLGRGLLRGKLFAHIVDEKNICRNSQLPYSIPLLITVSRKKIPNTLFDNSRCVTVINEQYLWVLTQVKAIKDRSLYIQPQLMLHHIASHPMPALMMHSFIKNSERSINGNAKSHEEFQGNQDKTVTSNGRNSED